MVKRLILLLVACTLFSQSYAWNTCEPLIRRYEISHGIPAKLLTAISHVESGRKVGRSVVAWPWTINANGKPFVFATKEEAISTVKRLQSQGINSIDVGCMQVNLKQHPKAFPSLEAAFDPATNIAYAAKFLKSKKENKGSWVNAIAHYHSATPEYHIPYRARVLKTWEKMQSLPFALHQSFLEMDQMQPEITPALLNKHKGEIVNNIDAPSGRKVSMIVRFAPYKGFNGGIPRMVYHRVQENNGAKFVFGKPIKANAKIIINTMGVQFPSQKVMQAQNDGAFTGKIINVSFKHDKLAPKLKKPSTQVLRKIRTR